MSKLKPIYNTLLRIQCTFPVSKPTVKCQEKIYSTISSCLSHMLSLLCMYCADVCSEFGKADAETGV